jgi:hypothetical protein
MPVTKFYKIVADNTSLKNNVVVGKRTIMEFRGQSYEIVKFTLNGISYGLPLNWVAETDSRGFHRADPSAQGDLFDASRN